MITVQEQYDELGKRWRRYCWFRRAQEIDAHIVSAREYVDLMTVAISRIETRYGLFPKYDGKPLVWASKEMLRFIQRNRFRL